MRIWTDEERKARSEYMKQLWKKRSYRRKIKETRRKTREEGKCLVNIPQLESDKDYRDYQRLQHRIWYEKNREKWNEYTRKQKLKRLSVEQLIALRDKHIRTGHDEWAKAVGDVLNEKQTDRLIEEDLHNG
jgi:hypothetical protein